MNSLHIYPKHPSRALGYSASVLLVAGFAISGCKKPIDDATLATNVQAALKSDATIGQQPVQVAVQSGLVTLTGNVSDETASSVAAQDAAKVNGVKEVVNSLTVAGMQVAPTVTSSAAPAEPRRATKQERVAISNHQYLPPPESPPAPPKVVYRDVSVPAGTAIPFRITETLDSETTQPGTRFNGVVTRDVVVDGYVVIPAGSAASGTVTDAKDAGHFKGNSDLTVELTGVRRHGGLISVTTEPYSVEGKGRGKNTAEKVGGGAVVGAVLGGIFGGGKGAAIGAAAGGGGGAAVQGFTRGQQVSIPSETVIRFRLTNGFTVHTSDVAADGDGQEPGLQTR